MRRRYRIVWLDHPQWEYKVMEVERDGRAFRDVCYYTWEGRISPSARFPIRYL